VAKEKGKIPRTILSSPCYRNYEFISKMPSTFKSRRSTTELYSKSK